MRFARALLLALFLAGLARGEPKKSPVTLKIDELIGDRWTLNDVVCAEPTSDAEFLRRVFLDLAGRIPSVSETRAFLADKSPDKRAKLVEQLLGSPAFVMHFTEVWRDLLLPEASASFQNRFLLPGMTAWIRKQLTDDVSLDRMAHQLLTVDRTMRRNIRFGRSGSGQPTPAAFYQAKENKPENLAGAVSKLFLGIRLECAQCHDHPFGDWSQEQFWSLAAFFAGDKKKIEIPGKDIMVEARFLDGTKPDWSTNLAPREILADWMISPRNPYFARAAVNRMWAYFFGIGFIDPVDEMVGCGNKPSHPELLNYLAGEFAKNGFDLKFLARSIVNSEAYQLSSKQSDPSQAEPTFFAKMPLRGLTPEQVIDSLMLATGYDETHEPTYSPFVVRGRGPNERARLMNIFAKQAEKTPEYQVSILQALTLMNGGVTARATHLTQSGLLSAVLDSPFFDTEERIETLTLAALSRKPTKKELARYTKYVKEATDAAKPGDKKQRYGESLGDIFWVMLNSSEFLFNH